MTLRESLVAAIRVSKEHPAKWLTYAAQHEDVGPSADELPILQSLVEALGIPLNQWGGLCFLADELRRNAAVEFLDTEAEAQIQGAEGFLDLTHKDFLRWPWEAMHNEVGGMSPGTLHYVVCPSKGGKTTLMRSATAEWCKRGLKVLYGGFEMKAETLRTMYAADECGLDPGDVTSGAWLDFQNHKELRARMVTAYNQQRQPDHWYSRLRFTGFETVGVKEVTEMMETAHEWGADAVVVDHVDQLEGDARQSDYDVSVLVNKLILKLAKRYGLKVILTSQTNNTGKAQDRWRDHRNLRDEIVRFGDLKRQVATTMTGLFRPVRPNLTKEEKERVELGDLPMSHALLTGANKFCIMANRPYGSRIGNVGYLGWERGRIVEPSQGLLRDIEAARSAIKTARGV
jgi:KaiC/GvpD/RAD55 family RecA-like ATPase